MFAVKTVTPSPASKQATAAASKIKNKILNTSSFFKVSLKTNNKALALALEAQKERSRQLEREVVYLQKQVEALCFELATRKYKDRKLLLILKNLHSNTLQHFDMVADIFSDSDLPKLSQDNKTLFGNVNEEKLVLESLTDQLPPRPEASRDLLCPSKNAAAAAAAAAAADLPEKNLEEKVVGVPTRAVKSTDAYKGNTEAEWRCSGQHAPALQAGAPRPSSSLREEVERLSMMFDMKSVPRPRSSRPSSVLGSREKSSRASASSGAAPPRGSAAAPEPDPGDEREEKTVLMNATMEMTQSDAAEIVTVETKAKKPGRPKKPKGAKRKEESPQVENPEDPGAGGGRTDPTGALPPAGDHEPDGAGDADVECPSPKKRSNDAASSRIPKLTKPETGSGRKKAKSSHRAKSKTESCGGVSPDLDDYFMDPENGVSTATEGVKLPPEREAAEETVSRVTFRRSRTKGRRVSSLLRKTSFALPPPHESSRPKPLHGEPEDVPFPADELKPRCRETFVISVVTAGGSPEAAAAAEQDSAPSTGSFICESEPTGADDDVRQRSGSNPHRGSAAETPSSSKRPWVATQDSGGSREDLSCSESHDAPPPPSLPPPPLLLHQDSAAGAEFQKPKKARREESGKKKARQRKEGDENKPKKKKKKRSCGNEGFGSEEEAWFLRGGGGDADGPEGNEQPPEVFDISEEDDFLQHLLDSRLTKTKSRNPKSGRNPRETFVVSRRETPGGVAPEDDLLADEAPPWLADVSAAHTELGSLLATPRREAPAEESAAVATAASPAGRVLTSLTNTITTPDGERCGRTRRRNGAVSYKEPPLRGKMRRGDKFTDSMFLSSPVFKDGKKKKKQKKTKQKLEESILLD